jgi:hypothetical protein
MAVDKGVENMTSARDTIFHLDSTSSAIFGCLHDRLFKGTICPYEGLQLWRPYMLCPLIDTTLPVLRVLFILATCRLMVDFPLSLVPPSWYVFDHTVSFFVLSCDV